MLKPTPIPTPTPSATTATSPEPALATATTAPSQPAEGATTNKAHDGSLLATLALFAAVIGVAVGWALNEITSYFKSKADAKRRTKDAEQERVLDFIHSAEVLSTAGNGIAVCYAAAASSKAVDRSMLLDLARQYNEAFLQLNRLRLEISIVGPAWVGDGALDVENAATSVQAAIQEAERTATLAKYEELIGKIDKFKEVRTALIAKATENLKD
ncbi:hypothetical protein ACFX43_16860 [Nocardioides sp. YIM B13467]|uniref:hypothetical protein n=1 Tax=Nocardioides sp. YIM B13467 TaxID=3366294 RepID=UPI003670D238